MGEISKYTDGRRMRKGETQILGPKSHHDQRKYRVIYKKVSHKRGRENADEFETLVHIKQQYSDYFFVKSLIPNLHFSGRYGLFNV